MRLRRDVGGNIGVFEDLQTLVVVVVGITILLGSTLYNWSAFGSIEQDQELFDEAEHIIKQIESWERLRAKNSYGTPYEDLLLSQPDLATLQMEGGFTEQISSDLNYNITFDDRVQEEDEFIWVNTTLVNQSYTRLDVYTFGEPVPEDKETVVLQIQYALVMEIHLGNLQYDVSERHPCLVTVVVWR